MNERRGKKRKQPPSFSTTVPVEEAPPKHPLTVAKNPNPIFFIGSPEKRSRTRRMINSVESIRWSTVGRYRVDVASFESLALPELQFKEDTNLFVIDEVGKMELFSSLFFPAVLCVLESKKINLRWLFLPTVNQRERERERASYVILDDESVC
ncbi:uncharacterized protein LOC128127963 [Lactuca sativa]|uniref:uncharacterized protein LOC128127963 n=1 Tax=Lactuca sativa TaxID=4236 RepID=UPI0022AF44FE|nr:uncharacterized protein LOC128127963 [Lactuca sativa]